MIIREHVRFERAMERNRSYVKPDRFGFAADPTERKRTYVQPDRFGFSGDKPEKRVEIRISRGQIEVVECE